MFEKENNLFLAVNLQWPLLMEYYIVQKVYIFCFKKVRRTNRKILTALKVKKLRNY